MARIPFLAVRHQPPATRSWVLMTLSFLLPLGVVRCPPSIFMAPIDANRVVERRCTHLAIAYRARHGTTVQADAEWWRVSRNRAAVDGGWARCQPDPVAAGRRLARRINVRLPLLQRYCSRSSERSEPRCRPFAVLQSCKGALFSDGFELSAENRARWRLWRKQ